MKTLTSITIGAVERERERERYFNKSRTKHEKCFIKYAYNRAIII